MYELLPPSRLAEAGGEPRLLGLGEVLQSLLLDVRVSGAQPLAGRAGLSELTALLCETGRGLAGLVSVRVLLDRQIPHVPGVRAVQEHVLFLGTRRRHTEPCHAVTVAAQ